ncbi:MAG TPA: adenylate/guanylate cyclase domain-containing protein [Burkholderiales bacterium]
MSTDALRQRLAAILAADVAGYSRLMSMDERATVAALDAARAVFRARIESNAGRVIDMAGDSVLAVFETATGAVSAALEVRKSLDDASTDTAEDQRMRFRIGVHLGDVIEKADGTIYGDGVNIAARLEGLAEAGGICVSESIRAAVRGKVEAEFEDLGEQTVKNIAEPVHAYRVKVTSGAGTQPQRSATDIDLTLPDKPSIAVLPFTNMSGDPEQEYFTDGVTEDIITELSRFRSLFVIARNSTFTYKGRAVDVRTVAKELGVRYVLEGSVRKAGNRVRVTGQLIDSLTGNHIWAERYDRVLEDVFEVQEEVTRAIVAAIAPKIDAAELEKTRRRRPESLSAYEIAVRAVAFAHEAMIRSDKALRDEAIREARRALEIDPRSAHALNALAYAQWQHLLNKTASDPKAAFDEGLAATATAIEADGSDHDAHANRAWLFQFAPDQPRWDEAMASAGHAAELNPNAFFALGSLGTLESYNGNPARGIELLNRTLRISPRDALKAYVYSGLASACFFNCDYVHGVEYAQRGLSLAPEFLFLHAHGCVNHVGLGQLEKAKAAFNVVRRLSPEYAESRLRGEITFRRPEDVKRYTTFLRVAAGLEDPAAADALR